MRKQIAAVALCMASITGGSALVGSTPVSADSRCNTGDHTHGALFWERTDKFLKRWRYTDGYGNKRSAYHHTNSSPKNGCANY